MKQDKFIQEIGKFANEKLDFFAKREFDFDFNNPEKYIARVKCTDHAGIVWNLEFTTNSISFEIKFDGNQEPTLENIYKELWEQACNVIESQNSLLGSFYTV